MGELDAASVDAIVCDPPYGLGFMGKEWDAFSGHAGLRPEVRARQEATAGRNEPFGRSARPAAPAPGEMQRFQVWCEAWAVEALRVLKPGGHLLAFGGTRTYHRLACAIEDAGFEIRDCIAWLYGSGFPKSLDVSKAIDAQAGAVREVVGTSPNWRESKRDRERFGSMEVRGENAGLVTAPATPDAERWQGWGTALKPAHEPVVVARKPLDGTVSATVLKHGTGALNVDGCRIGMSDEDREKIESATWVGRNLDRKAYGEYGTDGTDQAMKVHAAGRWPANVVLDPGAAAMLDEQTGERLHLAGNKGGTPRQHWGYTPGHRGPTVKVDEMPASPDDEHTGASRFFYVPKASSAERNAGLDGFAAQGVHRYGAGIGEGKDPNAPSIDRNVHPTVKPIDLMRWLVRLVTPPGGLVLDPFTGSGTTGCATVLEGFRFLGIEREDEYAAIAEARIKWWAAQPSGIEVDAALEANAKRGKVEATGQMTIV